MIRSSVAACRIARVTERNWRVLSRSPEKSVKSKGGGASVILTPRSKTRYELRSTFTAEVCAFLTPIEMMAPRTPRKSTIAQTEKMNRATRAPRSDVRKFFMPRAM